jgi:hypothetical protein
LFVDEEVARKVSAWRGALTVTTDNSGFQAKYTAAEKEELLAAYDAALNLTPEQEAFAQELRNFYEDKLKRANEAGIIRNANRG